MDLVLTPSLPKATIPNQPLDPSNSDTQKALAYFLTLPRPQTLHKDLETLSIFQKNCRHLLPIVKQRSKRTQLRLDQGVEWTALAVAFSDDKKLESMIEGLIPDIRERFFSRSS